MIPPLRKNLKQKLSYDEIGQEKAGKALKMVGPSRSTNPQGVEASSEKEESSSDVDSSSKLY